MILIDTTYFVGNIELAERDPTNVGGKQALELYINKYEPIFMRNILGVNFYNVFINDISQPRMIELCYGKDYEIDGKWYHWQGLVDTVMTGYKVSPIAMFIYLSWKREKATLTSRAGQSIPETDNERRVNAIQEMVLVECQMASIIRGMHHFLNSYPDVYPEWDKHQINVLLLLKNNEFGF